MSEGQRRASAKVAVGKLLVVAHIRTTYAGGLDLDLKLATRGWFQGSGFLFFGEDFWAIRICSCGKRTSLKSRAPCNTLAEVVGGFEERLGDSNNTGISSAVAEGAIL